MVCEALGRVTEGMRWMERGGSERLSWGGLGLEYNSKIIVSLIVFLEWNWAGSHKLYNKLQFSKVFFAATMGGGLLARKSWIFHCEKLVKFLSILCMVFTLITSYGVIKITEGQTNNSRLKIGTEVMLMIE